MTESKTCDLAERIAENVYWRIVRDANWNQQDIAVIVQSELSEREAKVERLVRAARILNESGFLIGREEFRAALDGMER